MKSKIKLSNFYQEVAPLPLIEIDSLSRAFYLEKSILATTKTKMETLKLEKYSLQTKEILESATLPLLDSSGRQSQIASAQEIGEVICLCLMRSESLLILHQRKVTEVGRHFAPITFIARHDNQIYSASQDMTIRVWAYANKTLLPASSRHILSGHTAPVNCLLSLHSQMVSGSQDRKVILWERSALKASKQFDSEVMLMEQCRQSDQLAVALKSNAISIVCLKMLRQQGVIVINRQICLSEGSSIKSLSQIDDSFLLVARDHSVSIAEVNVGCVMASIDLQFTGTVVSAKSIRSVTLLGIKNEGIFLLKF